MSLYYHVPNKQALLDLVADTASETPESADDDQFGPGCACPNEPDLRRGLTAVAHERCSSSEATTAPADYG